MAPKPMTKPKAACQLHKSVSKPPNGALAQANMPKPVKALDITRAPVSGVYRSRTMARAHITTAPMAAPCRARHTINACMLLAITQPKPASVNVARPHNKIGRRPKRSDSGPHTNCEVPKANNNALSVSCTCDSSASNSALMAGRAGKYKSVATGWMPMSIDSNTMMSVGDINDRAKTARRVHAWSVVAMWGGHGCIGPSARSLPFGAANRSSHPS